MSIREEPTPDPPGEGTQGYSGAVETKRQRVRIPGGQQGPPHRHPSGSDKPLTDDPAVDLDAFDEMSSYEETTGG
jgi:hypothetical protein